MILFWLSPQLRVYIVEKEILQKDGWLRLDHAKTVAINGLDGYAETKLIERFEYARPKK